MGTARKPTGQILNQHGGNKNTTQQQASKTPEPVKHPRTRPILNYTAFFQECFFEISVFFFQELHKILAVALSLERHSDKWAATGVSKLLRRTRRQVSLSWDTESLTLWRKTVLILRQMVQLTFKNKTESLNPGHGPTMRGRMWFADP